MYQNIQNPKIDQKSKNGLKYKKWIKIQKWINIQIMDQTSLNGSNQNSNNESKSKK